MNNQDIPALKKVSKFEFAIMQAADPDGAKNYCPYTEEEEFQQRKDNLEKQAKGIPCFISTKPH